MGKRRGSGNVQAAGGGNRCSIWLDRVGRGGDLHPLGVEGEAPVSSCLCAPSGRQGKGGRCLVLRQVGRREKQLSGSRPLTGRVLRELSDFGLRAGDAEYSQVAHCRGCGSKAITRGSVSRACGFRCPGLPVLARAPLSFSIKPRGLLGPLSATHSHEQSCFCRRPIAGDSCPCGSPILGVWKDRTPVDAD